MAHILGGTVSIYLLIIFILWVIPKISNLPKSNTPKSILFASLIALAIATLIGGYGYADGGDPVFEEAFVQSLIPAVLAASIVLFRTKFKKKL